MDRSTSYPEPSSVPPGAPDLRAAAQAFADFCVTVAALRDRKTGCPWDLQQDHQTLRRYMLEEAYEACEVMGHGDAPAICDELGDVLLQVVLNAQIALDDDNFSVVDVIKMINAKMRRRHPHVFGDDAQRANHDDAQRAKHSVGAIRETWEAIKKQEKGAKAQHSGFFADADGKHPASHQAVKIGKLASKIRFDWDNAAEVFAQVKSEVEEVEAEVRKKSGEKAKLVEEIGDVYFSLAQLCRHLDLEPEVVALDANKKFLRRFAQLERVAEKENIDIMQASREQLEALWQRAKKEEGR